MAKKFLLLAILIAAFVFAGSCRSEPTAQPTGADMPNPASVFCEGNGGTLELRTDSNGGQYGVCIFDDGSDRELGYSLGGKVLRVAETILSTLEVTE